MIITEFIFVILNKPLMKKPVLVIKFGSAAVTSQGEIDERVILEIARQVSTLQADYNIVIVSSGAVAAGKKFIPRYKGTLAERKAAAAIGNPLLIRKYTRYFRPFNIALAQSLCERHHFSNRSQFLQLKSTYETLWRNNVIPVANENDVVSNKELKFSDNDELATLIAVGFGARKLLLCTTVGGVLDDNNEIIPVIPLIDRSILALARTDKSSVGLGGMTSKLNFARLATQLGIEVVIFNMDGVQNIIDAVDGAVGTRCVAQQTTVSARRKWLASGSLIKGSVRIDEGAMEAVRNRKSLLAVGVAGIDAHFEVGEVFHIADQDGQILAVGKSKVDSATLKETKQAKNLEIAHADDIVLL